MEEILYLEVPTPDTAGVCTWLQKEFDPAHYTKVITPNGCRLLLEERVTHFGANELSTPSEISPQETPELSIFIWSLQRTTYLKVFRMSHAPIPGEKLLLQRLTSELRSRFPSGDPEPPVIDLSKQSIFDSLAPYYPLTVKFFQKMPRGEYDLKRLYWWETRWREGVRTPQQPKQVIFKKEKGKDDPSYDLIYVGGALGVIHAAVMARLGYRVLLLERLSFGRMNREWNISRQELQSLIDLGLFTSAEVESLIAREYKDGFHKFFDAYNPPVAQAAILHTPTVLNIALDSDKLLALCGHKLRELGGEIWDETEFIKADISAESVEVCAVHLPTKTDKIATGRLLLDAMGTASPIAWQLNGERAFDSVCPTVGAVLEGFEPGVWDSNYGDVLNSHGDISRGRQLIWELFPGAGKELTIYLFHYHQVHPDNPGSLLELYEDFFTILPEYRRCNMEQLVWKKPTFGYIPGHFSSKSRDRTVGFDRLVSIGDAASLQSPLVFTGFGSLVRNLPRLTHLLDTALKHNLLDAEHLNQIRAYQSNTSVTWIFSKGMMVPHGKYLPPAKINSVLNTFFGVLALEAPEVSDTFIKDRFDWLTFHRLALTAAWQNPQLLIWILDFITFKDIGRWFLSYLSFTWLSFLGFFLGWLPNFIRDRQSFFESKFPGLWLWLLATSYNLTEGIGKRSKRQFSLKNG
ncbi:MAG: hypothetical protein RLZZ338_4105 [Cyanobacteriota bacterium]|jgi:lycopene cyclase CruA